MRRLGGWLVRGRRGRGGCFPVAGRRAALTAALGFVAVAGLASSAQATFRGTRGPIAFQRLMDPNDESSGQIFRFAPRTGRIRQLTAFRGGSFSPDYSPHGTRILFERRFPDGSPDALYTMRADGSHPVRLSTGCPGGCLGDSEPAWAPSGRRIVFGRAFGPVVQDNASEVDLVVARADGNRRRVIRRFRLNREGVEPHSAQWSPDGRRLAVTLQNTTKPPAGASAIFVLRVDGSHLHRITPPRLNAGNPDWSPGGKRIVFNSSFEGQGAVEIYTVRPEGSGLRRLRREPEHEFSFDPVWSPDGRRIAFVHGSARGLPHIWTMKRNGTGVRRLTRGPLPDFTPDWGARR
jgi:TolB protein